MLCGPVEGTNVPQNAAVSIFRFKKNEEANFLPNFTTSLPGDTASHPKRR